jgi:pilus assembly protein CpaB
LTRRFVLVLVFAFVIAGGVSLVFYKLMTSNSPQKSTLASTHVVVAARDLQVGTLIKEDDVKMGEVGGSVPAGVTQKADLVVGRGVISVIYANEPLVDSRLAPRGAGAGLAAMIPPGMRAVAVRVNEVVGVAGFAVPGMRVDVLVSGSPPNQNQGSVTRTILQNIEVLSAGQNYQKDTEGKPVIVQVVNLLVNPEQAETLSLAGGNASIQLVLRNPLDTTVAKTSGTGMASLFGGPPPAPPKATVVRVVAPPRPAALPKVVKPPVIEMFEGNKRSEHSFTESAGGTQ